MGHFGLIIATQSNISKYLLKGNCDLCIKYCLKDMKNQLNSHIRSKTLKTIVRTAVEGKEH